MTIFCHLERTVQICWHLPLQCFLLYVFYMVVIALYVHTHISFYLRLYHKHFPISFGIVFQHCFSWLRDNPFCVYAKNYSDLLNWDI